jgi:hypothetical protein
LHRRLRGTTIELQMRGDHFKGGCLTVTTYCELVAAHNGCRVSMPMERSVMGIPFQGRVCLQAHVHPLA